MGAKLRNIRSCDADGVLQTLVRGIMQDGAGPHDNELSCAAAKGKVGLLTGNHDVRMKKTQEQRSGAPRKRSSGRTKSPEGAERLTVKTKLIGGLLIGGALGEVVHMAHGK